MVGEEEFSGFVGISYPPPLGAIRGWGEWGIWRLPYVAKVQGEGGGYLGGIDSNYLVINLILLW